MTITLTSPRYPESTVPGAFTSDMPQRAASPDRGCTNTAYPSGRASASPVGSTARSPGASSASTVVTTSAPASPGNAYAGSGTPGSRRWTRTSTGASGAGSEWDGGTARRLPLAPGGAGDTDTPMI